mmetsp:Transcript_12154/g.43798  ORF Transcript_12154/g.43798 Transcript_12154/m.43798 type:complete len:329 (+) Transcript_12154:471-1457(+)
MSRARVEARARVARAAPPEAPDVLRRVAEGVATREERVGVRVQDRGHQAARVARGTSSVEAVREAREDASRQNRRARRGEDRTREQGFRDRVPRRRESGGARGRDGEQAEGGEGVRRLSSGGARAPGVPAEGVHETRPAREKEGGKRRSRGVGRGQQQRRRRRLRVRRLGRGRGRGDPDRVRREAVERRPRDSRAAARRGRRHTRDQQNHRDGSERARFPREEALERPDVAEEHGTRDGGVPERETKLAEPDRRPGDASDATDVVPAERKASRGSERRLVLFPRRARGAATPDRRTHRRESRASRAAEGLARDEHRSAERVRDEAGQD